MKNQIEKQRKLLLLDYLLKLPVILTKEHIYVCFKNN